MEGKQTMNVDDFFPVYSMLYSQIEATVDKDRKLSEKEISNLVSKISKMDKIGTDMIYVFIRLHSLRHSDAKLLDVPFSGEKVSTKIENNDFVSDVKFDVRNFPPILCRMLDRFTTLHLRKIKEESKKIVKF